jgi:hypothetical protein
VTKINASGSALVYSTYLGGTTSDGGNGIAVDASGNAYVTGFTSSVDFPLMNPVQPAKGALGDAFLAKLNPAGSALVYSTYLGGNGDDVGSGVAVDSAGHAYVIGKTSSTDFPLANPMQPIYGGNSDAFVTKFTPAGSAMIYSTYLGGNAEDDGLAIAVDKSGNAYATGFTFSTNFLTTSGVIQPTIICDALTPACANGFVTKLNPTGSGLIYSTYLSGGVGGSGRGIAADGAGNAYVAGTLVTPTYGRAGNLNFTTHDRAFAFKINPTGSAFVYQNEPLVSTFGDASGIAIDSSGSAYVIGVVSDYWGTEQYPYVVKLNPNGSVFGSRYRLGADGIGVAADNLGAGYITGAAGANFPTKNALQPSYGGNQDAFLTKVNMGAATKIAISSEPNPSAYGQAVTFTASVTSSIAVPPDGETISFKNGKTLLGTAVLTGGSAGFTTSVLPVGTHSIQAVYGGDSNFLASTSTAVKQVVN